MVNTHVSDNEIQYKKEKERLAKAPKRTKGIKKYAMQRDENLKMETVAQNCVCFLIWFS